MLLRRAGLLRRRRVVFCVVQVTCVGELLTFFVGELSFCLAGDLRRQRVVDFLRRVVFLRFAETASASRGLFTTGCLSALWRLASQVVDFLRRVVVFRRRRASSATGRRFTSRRLSASCGSFSSSHVFSPFRVLVLDLRDFMSSCDSQLTGGSSLSSRVKDDNLF